MNYKKAGKLLTKIEKKNKKKINDKSFLEQHKRLTFFRIEDFKEDLQELGKLHFNFLNTNSKEDFEHFISMIYFVLEENIHKNLYVQFLHQKYSQKKINHLFFEINKLIKSLRENKKTKWEEKLYWILKIKTETIYSEMNILHSEKRLIKKIMKKEFIETEEGKKTLKSYSLLEEHFKQLHKIIDQKYADFKHEKNLSPNVSDLIPIIEKMQEITYNQKHKSFLSFGSELKKLEAKLSS